MFKSSDIQSEIPPVVNVPPEVSPQIMEAAPSGMILIDISQAGGPVVYANPAFEKITGYSREDILGKSSSFLNQSDTGQAEVDQLRAAIHDRTACTVTLRVSRQDGTPFWSEIRISPLRDAQGTVTYYLVVLNDVIRRTRSEHYLQGVLDSSLNGIMAFRSVRDAQGMIIDFEWTLMNRKSAAMVGRVHADLVGKRLLEEMPGNREVGLFDLYKEVVETGEPLNHEQYYEHENVRAWFQITAFKLDDGFVATFADITEQKQVQQHEFEIAVEKARSELMTQFIQDAAHEFRTPLSIINSSAYMMSRVDSAEKREEYGARIGAQVQRTTHLVDMLSKVVDLDRKRQPVYETVNMAQLIQAVCAHFQTTADDHTIQYNAASLPVIQGDAADLYEAFKEIVDNARKHIAVDGHVNVRSRAGADHITIEIEDSGSGINPEALPHIFEAFWRQDEARTTPGFGLGLTIAQKIIQMHGGQIIVQSTLDEGSLFSVSLPIMPPQT